MENVINTLPQKVSPAAVNQGASESLKTGHLSFADDLYKAFAEEDLGKSKMDILCTMAFEQKLTCEEFKKECKKAQDKADQADILVGFKAQEGAKGSDKYGPSRKVLNVRLAEAKAVYGMLKTNPSALKEKGFTAALDISRKFFKQAGIKWDGSKAPTDEQKATKAMQDAYSKAMAANPRGQDESKEDWLTRIEELAQTTVDEAAELATQETAAKVFASLKEKHGATVISALLMMIIDEVDKEGLETIQAYVAQSLTVA